MPVRPVVRFPHPVLKTPAAPSGAVGEERRALAGDLVDTMRAGPATVGLAAPQIGIALRAFAIDVSDHPRATSAHGLLVLFDPEVVERGEPHVAREGCLSVPDLTANVWRPGWVAMRGGDPEGRTRVYRFEGFEARAAIHEIDHLDGLLILDRVRSAGDVFARKVYR
jgi:peptide deformylase